MPAVSDLQGLRSTLSCGLGIDPTAVAADDRDAGILLQPGRGTCRIALRQQVERAPLLQVTDHGTVALSAFPGPVVDADDLWRGTCVSAVASGAHSPTDEAQHRRTADCHLQGTGPGRTGIAARCERDRHQGSAYPRRPPGIRWRRR